MYVYVVRREINKKTLNEMLSGKRTIDDKLMYNIVGYPHVIEGEIGYFETLQEAIDLASEDADMMMQHDISKDAFFYLIVKRKLGRFDDFYVTRDVMFTSNGVQCLVINEHKWEAD